MEMLKDEDVLVKSAARDALIKNIALVLPAIEETFNGEDAEKKKQCVEVLERSGYARKILSDIVLKRKDDKNKAALLLEGMIKAGAYMGLAGVMLDCRITCREKALSAIRSIDRDLAERISKDIKTAER